MVNYSEKIQNLYGELSGSLVVALVDSETGMLLDSAGDGVDKEVIGAGLTAFASAFNNVLAEMGNGTVDETVITIGGQFHAMHRVAAHPSVYLMAIVDSAKSNLATVRAGVTRTAASIAM